MPRTRLLNQLADMIDAVDRPHPVRVGIDGPGASGKTTLANDLIEHLQSRNRPVIHASVDGFHNPPEIRYQQGRDSVTGYYHDSFNHHAITTSLLLPLGPTGDRNYTPARYDFRTESEVEPQTHTAPHNAVLLFEGVFVLRDELRDHFDFTCYVDVDFEETTRRAAHRDAEHFGSPHAVTQRYRTRYIPGQQLHLDSAQPHRRANVVIDNNNPHHPTLHINHTSQSLL